MAPGVTAEALSRSKLAAASLCFSIDDDLVRFALLSGCRRSLADGTPPTAHAKKPTPTTNPKTPTTNRSTSPSTPTLARSTSAAPSATASWPRACCRRATAAAPPRPPPPLPSSQPASTTTAPRPLSSSPMPPPSPASSRSCAWDAAQSKRRAQSLRRGPLCPFATLRAARPALP